MRSAPRFIVGVLLACAAASVVATVSAQKAAIPAQPRPIKTTPPKDWLDPKTVAKQKKDAEGRALFAGTTPVVFTLTANMKAVQADRLPSST
jgi:hypothetical protein